MLGKVAQPDTRKSSAPARAELDSCVASKLSSCSDTSASADPAGSSTLSASHLNQGFVFYCASLLLIAEGFHGGEA